MIGSVPFLALEDYKSVNLALAVPRMARITNMEAVFRKKLACYNAAPLKP